MIKILVTGAGATLGQGIMKSLRRSTLDFRLLATDPNPLSAGMFWADQAHRIPMATDPLYPDEIKNILDSERPDIVLVGTDVELMCFAENRDSLEARFNTHIIVSSPRVIAIADDKYLTYQFLRENGFKPPASALAEDREAVQRLISEVGFPLVVKPRVGARSVGVSVVNNEVQLLRALEERSGLIVQECISDADHEYTSSVLVFDGAPLASIVMRRDLRDGNTYRAYTESYVELNAHVRQLGKALGPYGPANFQFRTDRHGEPRVFEINARFSGATPLRAMVGFNEVEMCIRKVLEGASIVQPDVSEAIILRHMSETLVTPAALAQVR